MARHLEWLPLAMLAVGLTTGCGSDKEFTPAPPFENLDDVRIWATSSSAVAVYSHAYKPIAVADGKDMYSDTTCPALEDDGATLTLKGDCTDTDGHAWKGVATVTRDGDDRKLVLKGFDGDDGTVKLHSTGSMQYDFSVDAVLGSYTTISYQGTVEGDYGARSTWSGSGHIKRDGLLAPVGEIDAATVDEVVDDSVCAGQPVSGATTLTQGNDTAVITYDGERDCDKMQNAALSVNGKDRGSIDGISCSVRAPGGSHAAATALLVAAAFGALGLRRRSRPTT